MQTLTPHFCLEEFTRSATASAFGICNEPGIDAISNLQNLCQEVLEPLRMHLGHPVRITSGFRCTALNKLVEGTKNSQHLKGEAADIHVPSLEEGHKMMDFIISSCPFDQLIWEYTVLTPPPPRSPYRIFWIHVSCRRKGKNRKQVINNLAKSSK